MRDKIFIYLLRNLSPIEAQYCPNVLCNNDSKAHLYVYAAMQSNNRLLRNRILKSRERGRLQACTRWLAFCESIIGSFRYRVNATIDRDAKRSNSRVISRIIPRYSPILRVLLSLRYIITKEIYLKFACGRSRKYRLVHSCSPFALRGKRKRCRPCIILTQFPARMCEARRCIRITFDRDDRSESSVRRSIR